MTRPRSSERTITSHVPLPHGYDWHFRQIVAIGISRPSGAFTDASYDPEVVVHEYTNGVSTRLIRQLGATFHGGAMGEAFSDFLSLS